MYSGAEVGEQDPYMPPSKSGGSETWLFSKCTSEAKKLLKKMFYCIGEKLLLEDKCSDYSISQLQYHPVDLIFYKLSEIWTMFPFKKLLQCVA